MIHLEVMEEESWWGVREDKGLWFLQGAPRLTLHNPPSFLERDMPSLKEAYQRHEWVKASFFSLAILAT